MYSIYDVFPSNRFPMPKAAESKPKRSQLVPWQNANSISRVQRNQRHRMSERSDHLMKNTFTRPTPVDTVSADVTNEPLFTQRF